MHRLLRLHLLQKDRKVASLETQQRSAALWCLFQRNSLYPAKQQLRHLYVP